MQRDMVQVAQQSQSTDCQHSAEFNNVYDRFPQISSAMLEVKLSLKATADVITNLITYNSA